MQKETVHVLNMRHIIINTYIGCVSEQSSMTHSVMYSVYVATFTYHLHDGDKATE